MSAKVIPIRPPKNVPRAVRGDYPTSLNGIHLVRTGDGYVLYRQHEGRRFEVPISKKELQTIFHEAATFVAIDNPAKPGWTESEL